MESNREVFLRMSEKHYMDIPEQIRMTFLSSKRVDEDKNDWALNMQDEAYSIAYSKYKKAKLELSEIEYNLREKRRKF